MDTKLQQFLLTLVLEHGALDFGTTDDGQSSIGAALSGYHKVVATEGETEVELLERLAEEAMEKYDSSN